MEIFIDFESRSPLDIKKCGAYAYAEHPDTEVLCLAVKEIGDDGTEYDTAIWLPDQFEASGTGRFLEDQDIWDLVIEAERIHAHNAGFERCMWTEHMVKRRGFPEIPVERWDDTAARAAMCALPRSLDGATKAVGVTAEKDQEGYKLMLKMCKPKALTKKERAQAIEELGFDWTDEDAKTTGAWILGALKVDPRAPAFLERELTFPYQRLYKYHFTPEDFERLCAYCIQDVEAEYALAQELPQLPKMERRIWELDQRINDRGILADLTSVEHAENIILQHATKLQDELQELTGGAVGTAKQVAKMTAWMGENGCEMDGLTKQDVKDALTGEIDPAVRRVLEIRQSLSMSSTAKLAAIRAFACRDGRLRGMFMYHGAGTGRWTGKGPQPQNFPRGNGTMDPEAILDGCLPRRDPDWLEMIWGDPMDVISSCLRGLFVASPGHDLIAADYSAIEGRGLAWLAGEEHVLEGYRQGLDPYKVAASGVYKTPYEQITKAQRQVGKTAELACFGPDTQVVTSNGVKRITEVSINDLLWDGTEWVKHQGVISKGKELTINLCGVQVTPDHLIRTGETWKQALELASSENTLCQALVTGSRNLPSSVLSGSKVAPAILIWFGFSAPVGLNRTWFTFRTLFAGDPKGVTPAQKSKVGTGAKATFSMQMPAPTTRTADDYLTDCLPVKIDATTKTTGVIQTTGVEELGCMNLGSKIRGLSSSMLSLLRAGTTRTLKWIASMWTKAMSPGTSGLSAVKRICSTRDQSKKCKHVSTSLRPVFDILNSGPRNCFTILCDKGPLIVHNCGYQGGWKAMLAFGADRMGMTEEEMKAAVSGWREARPKTVAFWKGLELAAYTCVEKGVETKFRGIRFRLRGKFLQMVLPSGRPLWYFAPRLSGITTPWGEEKRAVTAMTVDSMTKQWVRRPYHGGLWAENCFTANTLVVTARGAVPISKVTPHDQVWDGESWVTTNGPEYQGCRRVVDWLGVQVTKNHEITDGKKWVSVENAEEPFVRSALKWAQSSMISPSFLRVSASKVCLCVGAPAEKNSLSQLAQFLEKRQRDALLAERNTEEQKMQRGEDTGKSLKTQDSCPCGGTDTQEWCPAAMMRTTQPTPIMEEEVLGFSSDGWTIGENSSATQRLSSDGISSALISTGLTTRGTTAPETCGSLNGKPIQGISEPIPCCPASGKRCQYQNSMRDSAPDGGASTASSTTSTTEKAPRKLWRDTGDTRAVYDLLNCGPNKRFTIWTEAGPVVVHNCTQAVCRDLLALGLIRCEAAGYRVIGHVHDEIVAEVPEGWGSVEEMEAIMSEVPRWAEGMPINAEGYRSKRYKK